MLRICSLDDLGQGRRVFEIEGESYYVVRDGDAVRVFSLVCPHMGGQVEYRDGALICPVHRWTFDELSGKSVVGSRDLDELPVQIIAGAVHADPGPRRSHEPVWLEEERAAARKVPLDIRLLAHACLEIRHGGFTLLTDPWLDGPAFHGSWIQYPPAVASAGDLRPDALVLTHEHSDHCHVPSLEKFDRDIPVYFPAFPNGRIDALLKELGFRTLRPMFFGRVYAVSDDITITCYEPTSNWNDSIHLINVAGYRILNVNDAGINFRIASLVEPVDLICSSFGSGASAFPMCWTHLSGQESDQILTSQFEEKQKLLRRMAKVYQCNKVMTFASYFALWHPDHRAFQKMISAVKRSPQEIRQSLERHDVDVIDLLPGDTYSNPSGTIRRLHQPERETFTWERTEQYLAERFSGSEFSRHLPEPRPFDREAVIDYFTALGRNPEARYVKSYGFRLSATGAAGEAPETICFRISEGDVSVAVDDPACNLTIEIPASLMMEIVTKNLSWDEIYIGYWCRFHDENPYNVAFWRLLQAPYYGDMRAAPALLNGGHGIDAGTPISQAIERLGNRGARIMNRHGMYCVGCDRAPLESIGDGARKHGLREVEIEDLIGELQRAASGFEARPDAL